MDNQVDKNEELLSKQMQLLAEKSLNADADTFDWFSQVGMQDYLRRMGA